MTVYTPKPSKAIPTLWERRPPLGHPQRHGYSNYCTHGYMAVGKRRSAHLKQNADAIADALGKPYHYPYAGTITVLPQLSIAIHVALRKHLTKIMTKLGISSSWECEVTKRNQINYHLVFRHAPEDLMRNKGRKLRDILRKSTTVKLNQKFKPIESKEDAVKWCNYMSKLKFHDTRSTANSDDVDAVANQKINDDIYRTKRVLFAKMPNGERMHRHGDFGKFWEVTPTQLDKQYKARKQALEANRQAYPEVREAAKELAMLTGTHADKIEREIYREYTADPSCVPQRRADNLVLAHQHHGGLLEYGNYLREQEEWRLHEQRRNQRSKQPRRKYPKIEPIPWHPSQIIESVTS